MFDALELAGLLRRQRWPRERIDELRRVKLRRLIGHAYRNVPFYRRLMDGAGVKPEQIREPQDLVRIPVTTKQDLRQAGPERIAQGFGNLLTLRTSGHSGMPFEVPVTQGEARTRRLRSFRMLTNIGVGPWDRLVLLGPLYTPPSRWHRRLGIYRLDVIPLKLPIEEQRRRLKLARPDVMWVYPTTLEALLDDSRCELSGLARPRMLITSAEVMRPQLRARLKADMPEMLIANIYGSSEAGRIANECREHRGLHLEDDALIVELLENGAPVEPGREGTTTLTCLDHLAAPLIRYEQGDRCRLLPDSCTCRWRTPLLDLPSGRASDMLTLPGGRRVSALPLDVALRTELTLSRYAFVQESIGAVRAQLCFREKPDAAEIERLRGNLEQAAGSETAIHLELVPEIKFDGAKFKVFVSKI